MHVCHECSYFCYRRYQQGQGFDGAPGDRRSLKCVYDIWCGCEANVKIMDGEIGFNCSASVARAHNERFQNTHDWWAYRAGDWRLIFVRYCDEESDWRKEELFYFYEVL